MFRATELSGFGGGGDSEFSCDAVNFDGSNDYLTMSAWTGTHSSNELLVSYWTQKGADGDWTHIGGTDGRHNIVWAGNKWFTGMYTSGNARLYRTFSAGTYLTAATAWLHILYSINAGTPYLYINDTDVLSDLQSDDGTVDFDLAANTIGANVAGNTKMNGDMAEIYYNAGASLDLSDAANRAKFAVDGKPIFLGLDGSLPTGSAPVVYLHQDAGEAPANFKDNKGTGGDYTVVGTLTTSSTQPSY